MARGFLSGFFFGGCGDDRPVLPEFEGGASSQRLCGSIAHSPRVRGRQILSRGRAAGETVLEDRDARLGGVAATEVGANDTTI